MSETENDRESTTAATEQGMAFDKPMTLPVGDRFILAGQLKTRVILACEDAHRSDYLPVAVNERERAIKALIAAAQAASAPTEALADLPATPWTWRISDDRRWCEVWSGRDNDARPVALLHDDDHVDALVRLVNGLAARTAPASEVAAINAEAKALRDAADELSERDSSFTGERTIEEWLRERADRIEAGA